MEISKIETFGEGDSYILHNVVDKKLADKMFELVRDEVKWDRMDHRGGPIPRSISIQCDKEKDKEPIYRHPADEQPPQIDWTSTVKKLRDIVSEKLGQPLNHCLVQWYKGGFDYISEHADKTLDIEKGSNIVQLAYIKAGGVASGVNQKVLNDFVEMRQKFTSITNSSDPK